ncbi:MAG: hypothetical protein EZS28_027582 [Streblomastix strix]|uniref:Uncharacterized protein n=1 Tax=Streblomastix strix TaxID=222440 RepID=A0A5J4V3C6_9EUKA|nr:MAG: hypothetical protein EZS28_027582 [Streblomastix strix]
MEPVLSSLATCERPIPREIKYMQNTLLIRAAMEQDLVEAENLLTNFGADINERGTNNMNCLHVACEKGDLKMIRFFLERGIDMNAQEIQEAGGNTPLLVALKLGLDEVVIFLLNNNVDVDIADANGATPLHIAVMKNNKEAVEALLFRGANVERLDNGGKTAWYWANALHFDDIKALLPEQKFNWLKYQETIMPPKPKPKEEPKKKKKTAKK